MAPPSDLDVLKERTEENARGVYAFGQRQLDRVVSPSTRENAYATTFDFAQERPLFFAFVVFQLLFSFLPLVIFAVFSLSTAALALGAAIVFSLFWIGVAMLVLVPTLFLTSAIGLLVWLWAAGSFVVAKRLWAFAPASYKGEQGQKQGGQQSLGTVAQQNGKEEGGIVIKGEPET